jgi:hypothetical protein
LIDSQFAAEYSYQHPVIRVFFASTFYEIEQHHRIKDPLQALPDLPFGHLYQSWLHFKNALPENSDIHRFEAEWPTYGKHNQVLKL